MRILVNEGYGYYDTDPIETTVSINELIHKLKRYKTLCEMIWDDSLTIEDVEYQELLTYLDKIADTVSWEDVEEIVEIHEIYTI